jgi:ribosomal protein S18 acetylase RimI-like enzyme
MTAFASATPTQRAGAVDVWKAARKAAGIPPTRARLDRVRAKLASDEGHLLVGCDDSRVIAMALFEPYREDHGHGPVEPRAGHVSMVFVDPEHWGRGIGGELLDALHQGMRARAWATSSLWTRRNNERARRLYEGREYQLSGDTQRLRGHEIIRYELQLAGHPSALRR